MVRQRTEQDRTEQNRTEKKTTEEEERKGKKGMMNDTAKKKRRE